MTELLGLGAPIVQAPMAGSNGSALAIAAMRAGGLGPLPCATLGVAGIRSEVERIRAAGPGPINLNFFCHRDPVADPERMGRWVTRLEPYAAELGVQQTEPTGPGRAAFDADLCDLIEQLRPEIVSFHFGLPDPAPVERVRGTGATIMSSATTVDEARWLADHGCDVIIAQGLEAGGHRGMFLTDRLDTQLATMALVPQVVDAVSTPVVAAGGIADARGIAAALARGAQGVQIGTAFLRCPEASTGELHRRALAQASGAPTALTNVFTGRPARGLVNRVMTELGPMSAEVPAFPLATGPIMGLRAAAERLGSTDFSPLWAGHAAPLARPVPAGELIGSWIDQLTAH